MPNEQFLSRWPTGRGKGYIAYSWSLGRPLSRVGSLCYLNHQFEPLAVQVANTTSLTNGDVEVWSLSGRIVGPMFLHESVVFDCREDAVASINATMQAAIDAKQQQIRSLEREIEALSARQLRP